ALCRTFLRSGEPLGLRGGEVPRVLARVARVGPAAACVEDAVVDVALAIPERLGERVLVGQRGADLGVPDLLLQEHATLECGPRHLVLLLGRVVFRVEGERRTGAVRDVRVHEAVGGAGRHPAGLAGGQVVHGGGEAGGRVRDRDLDRITGVDLQRVRVRRVRADVRELRARRACRYAVGLQEREVDRLGAVRVQVEGGV